VTKVHVEVAKLHKEGFEFIMIGHKGHPEVEGTMGQLPSGIHLVEDADDVLKVQPAQTKKLAVVTQTTLSVDDAAEDAADGAVTAAIEVRGPGRARLVVEADGAEVDHIELQAARAVDSTLVDATILGALEAVDPRLPARFVLPDDATLRVLVSASDRCGEPLLDVGASSVAVVAADGADVDPVTLGTVSADGVAAFVVDPAAGASALSLQLQTPDLAPLTWAVTVAPRSAIDEVHAAALQRNTAAALEGLLAGSSSELKQKVQASILDLQSGLLERETEVRLGGWVAGHGGGRQEAWRTEGR
jgi:hypothetical protein